MEVEAKINIAKDYCNHVRFLTRRKRSMEEAIENARYQTAGVTGIAYSDMPGSPNAYGDAIPDGVIRLQELISEYCTNLAEYIDELEQFERSLRELTMPDHARLLRFRYLYEYEWEDIAHMLSYSPTHARGYMHELALMELFEHMPIEWKRSTP